MEQLRLQARLACRRTANARPNTQICVVTGGLSVRHAPQAKRSMELHLRARLACSWRSSRVAQHMHRCCDRCHA